MDLVAKYIELHYEARIRRLGIGKAKAIPVEPVLEYFEDGGGVVAKVDDPSLGFDPGAAGGGFEIGRMMAEKLCVDDKFFVGAVFGANADSNYRAK